MSKILLGISYLLSPIKTIVYLYFVNLQNYAVGHGKIIIFSNLIIVSNSRTNLILKIKLIILFHDIPLNLY